MHKNEGYALNTKKMTRNIKKMWVLGFCDWKRLSKKKKLTSELNIFYRYPKVHLEGYLEHGKVLVSIEPERS